MPILDYESGAWCTGGAHERMNSIPHQAIRFFCGLPRTTAIPALIGDMGWTANIVRRDLESIRMYNQIVKMDRGCITRKVFEYDCASPCGEWSANLKALALSINCDYEWENQLPINLKHAEMVLKSMYEEVWRNKVLEKPKLRTYVQLKESICVENHLKVNLPKWKRSLISQLRCGCLSLAIETGRFTKTPLECITCPVCKNGVEDEAHFLFRCEQYSVVCKKLYEDFPDLLQCDNDINKLKILLNMPYTFSAFIGELWNRRQKILA